MHSVYVFALGLAIYETNSAFRRSFSAQYRAFLSNKAGETVEEAAACLFLEYWGYTSLFHDIGYPFELPFEQAMSYFEVNDRKRGYGIPYVAYHDLGSITALNKEETARLSALYGCEYHDYTEIMARVLTDRLGKEYLFDSNYLCEILAEKPVSPNRFDYFMDHAYFSSLRLYRELTDTVGIERINKLHMDALSAILLHNSLFKFSISFYKDPEKSKKPLRPELHPLAWLLMTVVF